MAVRVSKIYGGAPVVNTFEIDDNFRERSDIQENIFAVFIPYGTEHHAFKKGG